MKRIFCIIFFFTVSLNLWSYTRSKETFEPVIIPDKTEPFGENKKTMPEPQKFYVAGSFGYIFASVPDIQIIQDDFTNAGITGLSNVGGFFNFNLEFGYENLFQHFDAFAIIGYRFTSVKSGTGDISYGLEPVNSTVGFGLYSVPFLIGAKYSFYNTSVIKLGTRADIGRVPLQFKIPAYLMAARV
ncbi:MAG: hypothetical protein NTY22_09730 [Proteobacteria bacterium]|nr:hypothetical protein [Pseudomonadota bacterium]